ncbi:MAG: DUF4173 domain-containing protein [Lachnospiraceae bacterium]|nr:DUF4173 domain-containing protein [Lachnospiraceae bacterium]MDD3617411.1 DUF4173 domain-containing protein [Lachnospiraceae bacterium]
MKEYREPRENYALFGGMALLYGVVFAFCLYRNIAGITFPIYVLATIFFAVLVLRHLATVMDEEGTGVISAKSIKLKKGTIPYFAGMMILGVGNACTTSEFFLFFNWVGIALLFVVAMVHQFYNDETWNFTAYFKRLVVLFFSSCAHLFSVISHGAGYVKDKENNKDKRLIYVGLGLAIAFGALCVIFPLLVSSDMIFHQVFGSMINHIDMVSILLMTGMVLAGTALSYAFLCGLCRRNLLNTKAGREYNANSIIGITFTAVIAVVYMFYSGIQIIYLFIGLENGLPDGVTYSQYAHSGFWQLLFVSIINFCMVLLCKNLFSESKILNVLLTVISLCTFVMIASAMYRMILYVQEYNLTFLRLLVLWFLFLLIFIMLGTVFSIYKKEFPLFRYSVAVVACFYIVFSLAKPDYQIARYNVAHDEVMTMQDLDYLIYQLSDDAAPIVAQIGDGAYVASQEAADELEWYFDRIEVKYQDAYFRKANLAKSQALNAAAKYK